jgi:hypothetical protein
MQRNLLAGAVAALLTLLLSASLTAQEPPGDKNQLTPGEISALEEQSAKAFEEGQHRRALEINQQLRDQRPFNVKYQVDVVRAAGLLDEKSIAYEQMLKMTRQGVAYDFNQTDDTLNIRKTELYAYLNDLMLETMVPAGDAFVQFTLPGEAVDFRSITWDSTRERFLIGTAKEGKVLAVSMEGEAEVLLQADDRNGLWSIGGIHADSEKNRLWISTTATPDFAAFKPADQYRAALVEFNLETLELIGTYFLPVDSLPHELGGIAVTDEGHVYVVDRATPIVYLKAPEEDRIAGFVSSKELVSLRDVTVTPDNSRIFVSDSAKGIFVVDPVAQQAYMLSGPADTNFGGIEGIEYALGELLIVQGGLQPQRLMRLKLDGAASAAEALIPMAVAIKEYDHPGLATLQGGNLYYLANTGGKNDGAGAVVMRTPVAQGSDIVPPDMRKMQRTLEERRKAAAEKKQ